MTDHVIADRDSMPGTIFRVVKNREYPYVRMNKKTLSDKRLSWEARGMLAFLLSKPDDWTVMFNNLVNESPGGAHKVRRILKELQGAGYMARKREHVKGRYRWTTSIYESPNLNPDHIE